MSSNTTAGRDWNKKPRDPDVTLANELGMASWLKRKMPEQTHILGDLVTTTTRMFLVGRTGLGKTLLGMAMAYAAARGDDFMGWKCDRAMRVLYIDGEMPAELIQMRLQDIMRYDRRPPLDNELMIFAADTADEVKENYSDIGEFLPLNTENGQMYLWALLKELGKIDLIIFDNVMSLITGDQKDEEPWSQTLPIVNRLSKMRIGQIWLDHTGHNSDRQYGSSTKGWRMDAIGIMTPLEDAEKNEVGFTLSFDHPGKGRRRTPENWRDFQTCEVKLAKGIWTRTPTEKGKIEKLPESRIIYHRHLLKAVDGTGKTTLDHWEETCIHQGSIERGPVEEGYKDKDRRLRGFRVAKTELIAHKWIAVDGQIVTDLRGDWGHS